MELAKELKAQSAELHRMRESTDASESVVEGSSHRRGTLFLPAGHRGSIMGFRPATSINELRRDEISLSIRRTIAAGTAAAAQFPQTARQVFRSSRRRALRHRQS